LKKAREFLEEGYNVKILGELRGRENWFKQSMYERMQEIEKELSEIAKSQGIKEEKR
jgi:translation initiation factor IF-3